MSLVLRKSVTAMGVGLTTNVAGQGGVEPYVYSVAPGGAGGAINASTGTYTAPATVNDNPKLTSDTIIVTDDDGATAEGTILVTDALGLFCEVIQQELGLANGRVYLWDQKIMQPNDSGLYVAVKVLLCKPFANTMKYDGSGSGLDAVQSVNMLATLQLDIISRGPAARTRKEEVLMALNSNYAQSQQELNSFYIGKLPPGGQFVNLSSIDGSAIPQRFSINVNLQYFVRKTKPVSYFDDFAEVQVTTEP